MKKLLVFSCLMLFGFTSYGAFYDSDLINFGSFTATSDNQVVISSNILRSGNVLDGVVISSPTPNGKVVFYDAFMPNAAVQIATIGFVNMGGVNPNSEGYYVHFGVRLSSGLTYTTTNNTNGITIIYKLSNPRL